MKYLNIIQSVLKADHKYSYKQIKHLNSKYEFNKYWDIFSNVHEQNEADATRFEQYYRNIFIKYFHNDIEINWKN
jgi:hypothetical protein